LPFREDAPRRLGGWSDDDATPLTALARALYEGGVVPVRAIARIAGVSVRTLYHHAHKRGWTMRNAAPVKGGAQQKDRRRAQRNALLPKAPGGLMSRGVLVRGDLSRGDLARHPQKQADAMARAGRAHALAEEVRAEALARRESEIEWRELTAEVRLLAASRGVGARKPRRPRATLSATRYDLSPQEMRAELARRMEAVVAAHRGPAKQGPSATSPSPPPERPSAPARRTEIIIARLQRMRRRPY
jgi:hypothetical protein